MIKLNSIKPNFNNPRVIKDGNFRKLQKSIQEFPQMMALRPIVIDDDSVILAGNMRYRALQDSGVKEVPDDWIKRASDLTEEQKREFIIKDNVGFGEWDWDALGNEWDDLALVDWGLDVPEQLEKDEEKEQEIALTPYSKSHVLISFSPEDINEVMRAISTIRSYYEIEQSAN